MLSLATEVAALAPPEDLEATGEARAALSAGLGPLRDEDPDAEPCGANFGVPFAFEPLASPDAFAASFAALCFSCSSLRSALVISFCFGFASTLGPLGGCTCKLGVGMVALWRVSGIVIKLASRV